MLAERATRRLRTFQVLGPRSLWMQEALALEPVAPRARLEGTRRTDVAIVGGGYTGLWTAIHLRQLDPSISVTLIESDCCGAGASGANGGFAMTLWPKVPSLRTHMSTDEALWLARRSQEAVEAIGATSREHGIDVHFAQEGWLWVATNEAQRHAFDGLVETLAGYGVSPFRSLETEEIRSLGGSRRHLQGLLEPDVATVHPGNLARGLARIAESLGVEIFEQTPAVGWDVAPTELTIRTPLGVLRTHRLVLATNAWLAHYPEVRRHLLVLGSDVVATAPVPKLLNRIGVRPGLAISDSRRLVHYYHATKDGRMIFGKGGGRIAVFDWMNRTLWSRPTYQERAVEQLHATYPELKDVPITHAWGGAVDYAVDSFPFIGELRDPRVLYAAGFSGNGVGPSWVAARTLAARTLDHDDDWANSPLVRKPERALPPEPLRAVGGRLVRLALERKESLEDRSQRPPSWVRGVAALDPTSFVG